MMTEKSIAVCIHLHEAETTLKYLSEKKLLKNDLKIKKDSNFIYLPVKRIPKELKSHKIIKLVFEKRMKASKTYKEIKINSSC